MTVHVLWYPRSNFWSLIRILDISGLQGLSGVDGVRAGPKIRLCLALRADRFKYSRLYCVQPKVRIFLILGTLIVKIELVVSKNVVVFSSPIRQLKRHNWNCVSQYGFTFQGKKTILGREKKTQRKSWKHESGKILVDFKTAYYGEFLTILGW